MAVNWVTVDRKGFWKHSSLVVGFGHEAQMGKDTVVNHLIQHLGFREQGKWGKGFPLDIRRYSFADALKVEVFDWLQGAAFGMSALNNFVSETKWEDGSHQGTKSCFTATQKNDLPYPLPLFKKSYTWEEKLGWINNHKEILRPLLQKWGTEFRRAQDPNYWVNQTQRKIQEDKPQVALLSDMRFLNETEICDVTVRVIKEGYIEKVAGKTHASEVQLDGFPYHYVLIAAGGDIDGLKEKAEILFEKILKEKGLLPQ